MSIEFGHSHQRQTTVKLWFVFLATSDLVTDMQVRRLFALVKLEGSLETAAAKAGMPKRSRRSAGLSFVTAKD